MPGRVVGDGRFRGGGWVWWVECKSVKKHVIVSAFASDNMSGKGQFHGGVSGWTESARVKRITSLPLVGARSVENTVRHRPDKFGNR